MRFALLLALLLVASGASAQSVRPIAITRTARGTATTLEFRDLCGTYTLWMDVSFNLRKWYRFNLGEVEGWGTFRLTLGDKFWSVGGCAFWGYHLDVVREGALWEDPRR